MGVADVLGEYLPGYMRGRKISAHQRYVLEGVQKCRTQEMGYHLRECDECGHQEWAYNSCRDRHCPKCQWRREQEWVENRLEELPRVPYHHAVVTLPDYLHHLMLLNQKVIYQILFEAVAETFKRFGLDEKYLGAEIGLIAVLHTWGQTLNYHVHLHLLVTGGGLTEEGRWVEGKYSDRFLFPIRAVSEVIRGKFMAKLRKAYRKGKLKLEGKIAWMKKPEKFEAYLAGLARHLFRVYSKPATREPQSVVRYLGAYMMRGPISDQRILGLEDGQVRFRYKDYRGSGETKICQMGADEFIRRYLCHVLPKRFVRVRYYGIFAGRKRKEKLAMLRALAGVLSNPEEEEEEGPGFQISCGECKTGRMRFVRKLDLMEVVLWLLIVTRKDYVDTS